MPEAFTPKSCRRLAVLLAAGGFVLAGAPALAQQSVEEITVTGSYGPDGEPRSLSRAVSYADLDLTTQAGQGELRRRISDTANDLCEELGEPRGTIVGSAVKSCRDEAVQKASGDLRTAIAQAAPRPPGWAPPAPELAAAPPPPPVAPAAESAAAPVAATTRLVTNGPVPDTPENRARYGAPMSNAGKRTAPAGN